MIVMGPIYNVCYFIKESNNNFQATFKYRFPDQKTYSKRIQKTFNGPKSRALKLAAELAKDISNGVLPKSIKETRSDEKYLTVEDYIKKVFVPIALKNSSPNTIDTFVRFANKEYFRLVIISEFDNIHYEKFKLSLNVSQNTISSYSSYLRQVLKFAKKLNHTEKTVDIKLKFTETKSRALTIEETQQIRNVLDQRNDWQEKVLFEFGLCAGLRIAERIGLNWRDINFTKETINLARQTNVKGIVSSLKNRQKNSINELPLAPRLRELLLEIPEEKRAGQIIKYNYNTARNLIGKIHKIAGLPKHLQSHSHRAFFISSLVKAGINTSLSMSLSRHNSYSVFQRYVLIDIDDKKEALKKLG